MGFKSVLTVIGADAKKVFVWVASPKGQAVIHTGEAVAEAIDPGLTGLINLSETYMQEIIKTEALAAAAGAQTGTGVQKSAAVVSAVTPAVIAYAKEAGLPTPTADQISKASDAMVAFLNSLAATL